jgi:hypothetical protein
MGTEDLHQSLGRLEGKVDLLIESFGSYSAKHAREHEVLDQHVDAVKKDINQAKGAKWAVFAMAGLISGAVAAAKDLFHR